jgi:hypothetical protein
LNRLEAMVDGRLAYRLKTPWRDGTTHVVMERRELLERLAPLIPPPRAHQVRYHGVLAPCASGRDRVVPQGAREKETARSSQPPAQPDGGSIGADDGGGDGERVAGAAPPDLRAEASDSAARRFAWADLLKRVFEIDALRCPGCGGRMRLIAAITEPSVARRILDCLAFSSRAPPLAAACANDLEPAIDPDAFEPTLADTQLDSSFDFDQTLSEGLVQNDEL